MQLFYCEYTKTVLRDACAALEIETKSSDTKEQVINALCRYGDQDAAHVAVRAAAGE